MKTTAVKGKPGIRIKENGKFIVFKSVSGKRVTKEFNTLRESEKWKKDKSTFDLKVNGKDPTLSGQGEGRNEIFFRDVYFQYLDEGMIELTEYTTYKKKQRMEKFLPNLFPVKMSEMNGRVILKHLQDMKLLVSENSKRCNFNKELKDLSSIFNWYDEEVIPFPNPIKRKHFKAGEIKPVEKKRKDIPPQALPLAGVHMRKVIRYLTVMQFLLAARIGEVCALNDSTVDFRNETIDLSETIVWMKGKPKHEYGTKTDKPNKKDMTPLMRELLLELKAERPKGCKWFFHNNGKPLRYALILKELNQALEKAGFGDYSGTHILRHSMATFTRKQAGLDVAQSILAHTSARQTESYAKLDVNKKVTGVVIIAEQFFKKGVTRTQPECNQLRESVN